MANSPPLELLLCHKLGPTREDHDSLEAARYEKHRVDEIEALVELTLPSSSDVSPPSSPPLDVLLDHEPGFTREDHDTLQATCYEKDRDDNIEALLAFIPPSGPDLPPPLSYPWSQSLRGDREESVACLIEREEEERELDAALHYHLVVSGPAGYEEDLDADAGAHHIPSTFDFALGLDFYQANGDGRIVGHQLAKSRRDIQSLEECLAISEARAEHLEERLVASETRERSLQARYDVLEDNWVAQDRELSVLRERDGLFWRVEKDQTGSRTHWVYSEDPPLVSPSQRAGLGGAYVSPWNSRARQPLCASRSSSG